MTMTTEAASRRLAASGALWNRSGLDLRSDETLVQLLDRGSIDDWRALYAMARGDTALAQRLGDLVATVPLPTVWFWRAALANLGVPPRYDQPPPYDDAGAA